MNPAHVTDVPLVTRTRVDTVILEMSGPHAETLAKILAHYDAQVATTDLEPVPHFEPDVWQHTLIDLLREKTMIHGLPAQTVDVDVTGVRFCPRCGGFCNKPTVDQGAESSWEPDVARCHG